MSGVTQLGLHLAELRMGSGAKSVSEYLKGKDLTIEPAYYRAIENGKTPSVDVVQELSEALRADPYVMFQRYLHDILPTDIFRKLIVPVVGESPTPSAKEALERKEDTLASYRITLQKVGAGDLVEDVYLASDAMVDFLCEHFELLPLVHFIYSTDREVLDTELRHLCEVNGINEDLVEILASFEKHKIADFRLLRKGRRAVRRYSPVFRLPPTPKGRALRARWLEYEVQRSLGDEPAPKLDAKHTFSFARIDCYEPDKLAKVNDRITDAIAELHAASSSGERDASSPYFVSIIVSPRPEYSGAANASTGLLRTLKVSDLATCHSQTKGRKRS